MEQVTCIYFTGNIIESGIIAVGDDGLRSVFKLLKIIDHFAAKEGASVFKGRFVDDDTCAFGLDAFHHALY